MGVNNPDPAKSRIQLEILRERQRHSEGRIRQLEQELTQAHANLGRKEKELEQEKRYSAGLKIQRMELRKDLQHTQYLLAQNSQVSIKKRTTAKLQAFVASIIFLISSVLVNFATSMLTSSPPSPSLGWSMLGLAAVAYLAGAFMTTLLASKGGC